MSYPDDSPAGRFLRGDEETLGEVIRWIVGVITSPPFGSLRADWNDVQQDALRRVLESLQRGQFDDTRSFRAYVRGVARITALQARIRRREDLAEDPLDPPDERLGATGRGTAESLAVDRHMARMILDEMSEECRQIVWSHYCDGKTFGEIAEEEGIPIGTVKSRIFRCLSSVRQLFSRPGPIRPKGKHGERRRKRERFLGTS